MSVRHTGSGELTAGFGDATLAINFDADTVSGVIAGIVDVGGSSSASFEPLSGASITLQSASISGNEFSGKLEIDDPAKLLLDASQGEIDYSGTFYERFGTSVGGYFSDGTAISGVDGKSALISGSFAAEDLQYGSP